MKNLLFNIEKLTALVIAGILFSFFIFSVIHIISLVK